MTIAKAQGSMSFKVGSPTTARPMAWSEHALVSAGPKIQSIMVFHPTVAPP